MATVLRPTDHSLTAPGSVKAEGENTTRKGLYWLFEPGRRLSACFAEGRDESFDCDVDPGTTSCLTTALSPGTYFVLATSAAAAETGDYTLEISCATPCSAGGPYDEPCAIT